MNRVAYERTRESLQRGHQVMVFVHARKDTVRTAQVRKNNGNVLLYFCHIYTLYSTVLLFWSYYYYYVHSGLGMKAHVGLGFCDYACVFFLLGASGFDRAGTEEIVY